jgi:hypothetical protein
MTSSRAFWIGSGSSGRPPSAWLQVHEEWRRISIDFGEPQEEREHPPADGRRLDAV